jgi:hypothetical protein
LTERTIAAVQGFNARNIFEEIFQGTIYDLRLTQRVEY